ISTVTFDILPFPGHILTKVMLGHQINSKMIFENFNVFVLTNSFYKHFFYRSPGLILMMKYPVLGMTSLHGHIKAAVSLFVKINPHINQLPYPCGGLTDNHPHNLLITISVSYTHLTLPTIYSV